MFHPEIHKALKPVFLIIIWDIQEGESMIIQIQKDLFRIPDHIVFIQQESIQFLLDLPVTPYKVPQPLSGDHFSFKQLSNILF